ncbi:MAG: hypothetical protein V2A63_01805 [Patescibacteria group bacterium]
MRKIFLALALLLPLLSQTAFATSGVGIIDASEQAGLEITCPIGTARCVDSGQESQTYSATGMQRIILYLLGGLLDLAAIVAVVMLVIAGLRLVLAHGAQDAITSAKKHITWTLAGLVVIILSLLIVQNVTKIIYGSTQSTSDIFGLVLSLFG